LITGVVVAVLAAMAIPAWRWGWQARIQAGDDEEEEEDAAGGV